MSETKLEATDTHLIVACDGVMLLLLPILMLATSGVGCVHRPGGCGSYQKGGGRTAHVRSAGQLLVGPCLQR